MSLHDPVFSRKSRGSYGAHVLDHLAEGKDSLHVPLVGLDHLLDHLAADGAGFAGGQVAVIAVLQVDADLPRRSFTY